MQKFNVIELWELYQGLFTERQREICTLSFHYDLTLAEIAEQLSCSRQSVSECLKTCRQALFDYEEKLHLASTMSELAELKGEKAEAQKSSTVSGKTFHPYGERGSKSKNRRQRWRYSARFPSD